MKQPPFPSLAAIQNVFELAVQRNPGSAGYHPLALWDDSHFIRALDDSGYIDQLYK